MFLHRRCAHIEIKLQNHPTRLQFYTVFLVYWCHSGYAVLFSNISKFAFIYKSTTVKLTAVLLNKSPFHPPPCSSLSLSGAKLGSAWLKEGWSSLIHQKQVTHAHTQTHTHTHTHTHTERDTSLATRSFLQPQNPFNIFPVLLLNINKISIINFAFGMARYTSFN